MQDETGACLHELASLSLQIGSNSKQLRGYSFQLIITHE